MIRGAFSHSGTSARDLGLAPGAGADEHVALGPLSVAWDTGAAAGCRTVDGVTCILGGYLYDADDLARELGVSATNAAQLVALAYRRLGDGVLTQLRGRFALALWDSDRRRGLLASDLLAVEPLFVWRGAGRLLFASELRDLLAMIPSTPGPDAALFARWLGDGTCPSDRTLYEGVARLRPGHVIDLGDEASEPRRYWTPRYSGTLEGTRDELADALRDEIERSVRRRLSHGRSGVILSGGLDSSIVTALAARHRDPGTQLRTYSCVFPAAPYDEAWKVRSLTSAVGLDPPAFELEPQGALWLGLQHVKRWGLPLMGAGSLIDIAMANEAARDSVQVLMDGQTGDETLGFAPYVLSDRLLHGRLLAAWELAGRWPIGRAATARDRRRILKRLGVMGAVPHGLGRLARRIRDRHPGPAWLEPTARRKFVLEQDEWAWKIGSSGPRWWRYLSDRLIEAPHRELRTDYLRHRAAAVGVINESPLYDFDLISFCLRLPPELAFASAHTRPLARHAMRGLLPDDVRLNDKKADFSSFCYEMLTNADAPGIERLLSAPDAEIGAYADMEWVRRQWFSERPAPGTYTGPWGTILWRIASGECWLRSQADPGFIDEMLAQPDVLAPTTRRVPLAASPPFSHLAPSEGAI